MIFLRNKGEPDSNGRADSSAASDDSSFGDMQKNEQIVNVEAGGDNVVVCKKNGGKGCEEEPEKNIYEIIVIAVLRFIRVVFYIFVLVVALYISYRVGVYDGCEGCGGDQEDEEYIEEINIALADAKLPRGAGADDAVCRRWADDFCENNTDISSSETDPSGNICRREAESYCEDYAEGRLTGFAAEGGPCRRWVDGYCEEARDVRDAMRWARYYLHRGDAESALVYMQDDPAIQEEARARLRSARDFYRRAIEMGSGVGSQAALYAAKRIQYQSMTCIYDEGSLARIARDWDKNPLGDLIEMKQKQAALKALGYYNGKVDNRHGANTRGAVRLFQADVGFDQTGVLTAEQTVLLICGGGQIAKDVGSQNVLGIMYATGLGVRQNTDFALNWLEAAAQRGDSDALWNLALMYGTRTVLSSVLVCDAVQNAERADAYLYEAARAGHPAAKIAIQKYRGDPPELRWRRLSGDLNRPEAVDRVGRGCNPNN